MQPISAESAVVRTYLDWLFEIPWLRETEDILDIDHAESVLDAEHYGLEKVKERVLSNLNNNAVDNSQKEIKLLEQEINRINENLIF